jgi:3-oxoacyl-ACP reductase-like protein
VKRNDVPSKFGIMENEKPEKIKEYMDTLYKIENISKPIKGLSSYKVSELVDMSKKLGLETINNTTNKQKTKNELYESLVQQF